MQPARELVAAPTDEARFKEFMSGFPSGVAVVTTTAPDGTPRGMTCSSLTSVTTEPPVLLVCLHNSSGTLAALRETGVFAVNLLHGRGREAAERFATASGDRFAQVEWTRAPGSGLPHLCADAHSVAECRVTGTTVVGDHTVVFGEVEVVAVADGDPLLYGRRGYAHWPRPAVVPDSEGITAPDLRGAGAMTPSGYKNMLLLDELLSAQRDPSEHDELLFVIVHQVHELWFKLMVFELDEVRDLIAADRLDAAAHLLHRLSVIQNVLVSQWAALDTMLPADFLAFRTGLRGGSGFESVQYREIEFLAGLRDETYLDRVELSAEEDKRLRQRLAEPSLREVFLDALSRAGYEFPAQLCRERYRDLRGEQWRLLRVAEGMLDLDQALAAWRNRHALTVERQIGNKPGTGGSSGVGYLRTRTTDRLFPELWDLRGDL